MRKSKWIPVVYALLGFIAGSLLGKVLPGHESLRFLVKPLEVSWHPAVNLDFLMFDLHLALKLHLLNFLGLIAALWLYRRT